jgi:hypothetical protein
VIRTCARMCVMQSREIVHAPAVAGTRPAGRLRSEPEICACDFKFILSVPLRWSGCASGRVRRGRPKWCRLLPESATVLGCACVCTRASTGEPVNFSCFARKATPASFFIFICRQRTFIASRVCSVYSGAYTAAVDSIQPIHYTALYAHPLSAARRGRGTSTFASSSLLGTGHSTARGTWGATPECESRVPVPKARFDAECSPVPSRVCPPPPPPFGFPSRLV